MKYCITTEDGTVTETTNKYDFLQSLQDEMQDREDNGEECFNVTISTEGSGDDE